MGEEEYESLPESISPWVHATAGGMAGFMEHGLIYPLDCVKTRMQTLMPSPHQKYRSIAEALLRMVKQEGVHRIVRGMPAVVGGAGPAHAMYFSCYEKLKVSFSNKLGNSHHIAHGLAGSTATLFHDAIMVPADAVKQRMQMFNSPYRSCTDCIVQVYRKEGIRAFYRSYTTQICMNVPFHCMHFVTYEMMQDLLNPVREYNPGMHCISGAMAGALAAAFTTPLDVCKTLLNTQERTVLTAMNRSHVSSLSGAAKMIYTCCGVRGYFNGLQARVLFQMPSTAISWTVYEFFKYFLSRRGREHGVTQRNDFNIFALETATGLQDSKGARGFVSYSEPVSDHHPPSVNVAPFFMGSHLFSDRSQQVITPPR